MDALDALSHALGVVLPGVLLGGVDDAARVGDEVGRVDDVARGEILGGESSSESWPAARRRSGSAGPGWSSIEHAAERTGGEHVHLSQHGALDRSRAWGSFARARLASSMSAMISSAPWSLRDRANAPPTAPTPTTATVRPSKLSEPKRLMTHARMVLDAGGGERAGIAHPPFAREPDDVSRSGADELHVGGLGAHVLGADVHAVEELHAVGQVQQRGLAVRPGLHRDHALAATERKPRRRGLVGHAA